MHASQMNNPWLDLPTIQPYIAPTDLEIINNPLYVKDHYRFDAFPDPFVGNFDTAKVVFLSLNPGFKKEDVEVNLQSKVFLEESLKSIQREPDARFFYWLPELSETYGQKWWKRYMGKTIREQEITTEQLLANMMQIEYLAYHSETYRENKLKLPTQEYSLGLVREAITHNKMIVLMRKIRDWYSLLPELQTYANLIILDNPQGSFITENNMKGAPPGSFNKLVAAFKS